jgi:hypothetical protein
VLHFQEKLEVILEQWRLEKIICVVDTVLYTVFVVFLYILRYQPNLCAIICGVDHLDILTLDLPAQASR